MFVLAAFVKNAVRCAALVAVLAGLMLPASAMAQPSERDVKAAFLLRFTDYVRWPEGSFPRADSPLVIGLIADRGVGSMLQSIAAGRRVQGHPVVVRTLREREPVSGVHVLFIGEGANAQLANLIRSVDGAVLIVTESDEGLARGSVINFVTTEERVRFEVALKPASVRSLTLGSGLLSVALNVRKDSRAGLPMFASREFAPLAARQFERFARTVATSEGRSTRLQFQVAAPAGA